MVFQYMQAIYQYIHTPMNVYIEVSYYLWHQNVVQNCSEITHNYQKYYVNCRPSSHLGFSVALLEDGILTYN